MNLNEIYTLKEASEVWGISDSNLRNAFRSGRFDKQIERGLARRSGSTWIITKQALWNVFGEPREEKEMIKFEDLNERNSTVFIHNGIEIKTTQDPYISDCGNFYKAHAMNIFGGEYEVEWEIINDSEDESEACDWDNPVEVKVIG